MNILIIGNGFDLAHRLPTKYTHFLEWIVGEVEFWEDLKKQCDEMASHVVINLNVPDDKKRKTNINYRIGHQLELWNCIDNNDWFEYFLQCDMHGNENWIDFESEISKVIKSIDEDMKEDGLYEKIICLSDQFFNNKYTNNTAEYYTAICNEEAKKIEKPSIIYKEFRDKLINDLDKLIRAFEIYLSEVVGKIDCNVISPDIEEILLQSEIDKSGTKKNIINKVLSFNYSNTYERIYLFKETHLVDEYIDYIHGKADAKNTLQSNNMVLGIDEYLTDDRKNNDIEFIAFKKFFQRIHKGTGCRYKDWVDEIQKNNEKHREDIDSCKNELRENKGMGYSGYESKEKLKELKNHPPKHNLYIFGHSLDVTDKDILRDLILSENVYTTIFYHQGNDNNGCSDNGRTDLGQKIANLVRVIGQDELIRRTGGSTPTIEFKLQQDMVERKE